MQSITLGIQPWRDALHSARAARWPTCGLAAMLIMALLPSVSQAVVYTPGLIDWFDVEIGVTASPSVTAWTNQATGHRGNTAGTGTWDHFAIYERRLHFIHIAALANGGPIQ